MIDEFRKHVAPKSVSLCMQRVYVIINKVAFALLFLGLLVENRSIINRW